MDYSTLRKEMVKKDIENRGISDKRILNAFNEVKRHLFIPEESLNQAYEDHPLPIGERQTISQPYIVAFMIDLLELKGDEKVLEIGTGSGYQTAILSKLCKEVISIERIDVLAKKANKILEKEKYHNIKVIIGDGSTGYGEEAPYDAIIVSAATTEVPIELVRQLKDRGRLVIPVGSRIIQQLVKVTKTKDKYKEEYFGGCLFVPLIKD